jgi:hypothetical protein
LPEIRMRSVGSVLAARSTSLAGSDWASCASECSTRASSRSTSRKAAASDLLARD